MSVGESDTATIWTDPGDALELTDEFFERADEYAGEKLIRRGRPKAESPKLALTIRYDADIVAAFKQPAEAGKPA